jgi:hypothetical protein
MKSKGEDFDEELKRHAEACYAYAQRAGKEVIPNWHPKHFDLALFECVRTYAWEDTHVPRTLIKPSATSAEQKNKVTEERAKQTEIIESKKKKEEEAFQQELARKTEIAESAKMSAQAAAELGTSMKQLRLIGPYFGGRPPGPFLTSRHDDRRGGLILESILWASSSISQEYMCVNLRQYSRLGSAIS